MIWCRNYGVRTRLSAKSPTSVYRIRSHAGENERKFLEIRCWRVKNYSWDKSILLNDGGKLKKTNEQTNKQTELFNLSNKIIQTSRCRPPCIKRETLKMHDLLPLLIIFQAKFFLTWRVISPFCPRLYALIEIPVIAKIHFRFWCALQYKGGGILRAGSKLSVCFTQHSRCNVSCACFYYKEGCNNG